jgi:hypothetical protein
VTTITSAVGATGEHRAVPDGDRVLPDRQVGKLHGHRKRIPAQVVRFPFYDPDKTRPRS